MMCDDIKKSIRLDHCYALEIFEEIVDAAVQESASDVAPESGASPALVLSSLQRGMDLAHHYLASGVKPSTRNQYTRIFKIWTEFCIENNLPEFDCGPEQLAACLSLVMAQSKSLSKVNMLSAAVANEYRIRMKPSPTSHESISLLFRGFRLSHSQERDPMLPLSDEILHKMIDQIYLPVHGRDGLLASLVLWRTVWRALMEFYTLGRYSDVIKLRRADVVFEAHPVRHLNVSFRGGKNDLYSEGGQRVVASFDPPSRYCPVNFTQSYFQYLGCQHLGYLIPCCDPHAKPDQSKPLPYNAALSDLRTLLDNLGYQSKNYDEHSGKRGGASAMAENGISKDDLQRLGGWRSEAMPSKYTDMSTGSKLQMAKYLQKRL
jgi:hypothetical protein